MGTDLFGNEIQRDELLRDKYIEPPFSVLDTKSGSWQARKKLWIRKGIRSEVGRSATVIHMDTVAKEKNTAEYVSVFDPSLCEVIYHWFVPNGGKILDPFAGGSVRGIVAGYLGYEYTGIEIRPEQVASNVEQSNEIAPSVPPNWIIGDSDKILDVIEGSFDFVFSCPPYGDLEVYSDIEGDISNMAYPMFLNTYRSIIKKSCNLLKSGGYACFVVGEFRDKHGNYVGFVPDTIRAFIDAGLSYYNEAILLNPVASASMRANGNMKSQKLVKIHQNVLVFKKP
jgi:DNA modification methylase